MKDPKEKEEKVQKEEVRDADPKSKPTQESNWNEHQRVDEEGNELDPDDIK